MVKYTMVATITVSGDELTDMDVEQIEESVRKDARPFPEFISFKIVSMTCELVKFKDKEEGEK